MTPELVTLEEAKLFCRISNDEEDAIVTLLITAATDAIVDFADAWTPSDPAPARIKLAILAHVARAYDDRDGADIPASVARLVFPLRRLDV